ncbi:uncharacterized protein BDW43DRAFT_277015 [Aspergillus alliaceus]|uniref:uncharacterized protein n=1 Tax=Petromyces alliaceus TaxID=209559 RepID=UPI0012A6141B|nr:uncharacterized protein BDW43DRAFT_277015 [Aspergillus alliaceus]KAB8233332.1 hypothetical protein BDW43DRAFT_277015 [Aspergillus alliaceus]
MFSGCCFDTTVCKRDAAHPCRRSQAGFVFREPYRDWWFWWVVYLRYDGDLRGSGRY